MNITRRGLLCGEGRALNKIKLMAIDIDGCITPGEGAQADFDVLKKLRDYNERSVADPDVPAMTLCTGRQQPFVDLMCQMTGITYPAIFENGGGLYFPVEYAFRFHPLITGEHRAALLEFKKLIHSEMELSGEAFIQPGKEVSLSIYPAPRNTVASNLERLRKIAENYGFDFYFDETISCINILVAGVNKGSGVRWLSEITGISTDEMGAIGDSIGDAFALEATAFPACPANANPELKKKAAFIATEENGKGVIQIMEEAIRRNKTIG